LVFTFKTLKQGSKLNSFSNANKLFKRNFAVGTKRNLVKEMETPKKETRIPSGFDKEQRRYVPQQWKEAPAAQFNKIKVLTWNVWFDESQYDERVKHQFNIMKSLDADVISLQEVLPLYLQKLANEEWVKNSYQLSEFDGTQIRSYDTVLLSKFPIKTLNVHMLHSYMSRKLYVADTELNKEPVTFATVHLESLAKNTKMRKDQLGQTFTILKNFQSNVFLFGDLNFCASIGEDQEVDPRFKDAWAVLKPNEFQPTVGTHYPRAEVKPARVDRIYSSSSSWVPTEIQLIGGNKIRQTVMKSIYPSDHLGVLATYEYRPGQAQTEVPAAQTEAPAAQTAAPNTQQPNEPPK